jgi:hypothetical protein
MSHLSDLYPDSCATQLQCWLGCWGQASQHCLSPCCRADPYLLQLLLMLVECTRHTPCLAHNSTMPFPFPHVCRR